MDERFSKIVNSGSEEIPDLDHLTNLNKLISRKKSFFDNIEKIKSYLKITITEMSSILAFLNKPIKVKIGDYCFNFGAYVVRPYYTASPSSSWIFFDEVLEPTTPRNMEILILTAESLSEIEKEFEKASKDHLDKIATIAKEISS